MPSHPLYLTTAVEAVVLAGDLQMARFGGDFRIDKKGTIDLVTEVDIAVERRFRALIAERFPDHQILAEELGGAAAAHAGPCWVFDPIDGTTNFTHGLPIFCSSLALEIDGVPDVAAVYDPNRRELFTAERGGGAFLNGAPLVGERPKDEIETLAFEATLTSLVAEKASAVVGLAYRLRIMGSLALALCNLAQGRLDAVCSLKAARAVDIAAAQLLVRERGLAIELVESPPFLEAPLDLEARSRVVAAGTPELCEKLAAALSA